MLSNITLRYSCNSEKVASSVLEFSSLIYLNFAVILSKSDGAMLYYLEHQ